MAHRSQCGGRIFASRHIGGKHLCHVLSEEKLVVVLRVTTIQQNPASLNANVAAA